MPISMTRGASAVTTVVAARDVVFERLYAELVAAWPARLKTGDRGESLAERVGAEERYRPARAAMQAWHRSERR